MTKRDFETHTYREHVKESVRWHRTKTGYKADTLVDSARINADLTKREDPSVDWEEMYRSSLRCLLSDEPDHRVRRWFYSRGFHF